MLKESTPKLRHSKAWEAERDGEMDRRRSTDAVCICMPLTVTVKEEDRGRAKQEM
jgi:hypothetical protein